MAILSKQRFLILLLLIVVVPVGFFTKFYDGPAKAWVNDSLGGLLYEVFWCLVAYFFFPKTKPIVNAVSVFIVTCLLEILQLWHPAFLEILRGNFIGRTILGNSFNWFDFPYYFIGSAMGYFLLIVISKLENKRRSGRVHKL
jgi:hypothetical protein